MLVTAHWSQIIRANEGFEGFRWVFTNTLGRREARGAGGADAAALRVNGRVVPRVTMATMHSAQSTEGQTGDGVKGSMLWESEI